MNKFLLTSVLCLTFLTSLPAHSGLIKEIVEFPKKIEKEVKRVPGNIADLPGKIEKQINRTDEDIEKIGKKTGDILEQSFKGGVALGVGVTKLAIVPYNFTEESVRVVLGKQDAKEAWDRFEDRTKASAQLTTTGVVEVTSSVVQANELVRAGISNVGAQAGGPLGEDITDAYLSSSRYSDALALTAARYADAIAKGEDPSMILAALLSASLQQAYLQYWGSARPVPQHVSSALRPYFGETRIDSVRYVVGTPTNLTLPDGLGGSHKIFGKELGVTIGDLIIFTREPSEKEMFWWAHEIAHTQQYAELGGIEQFSWAYIKHFADLERKADAVAASALASAANPSLSESRQTEISRAVTPFVLEMERLVLPSGWQSWTCAAPPTQPMDGGGSSITIALKNLVRDGDAPCAVALLDGPHKLPLQALLYYDSINAAQCSDFLERRVEKLQVRGWSCSADAIP